jgi:3-phosphoshikimate 1-carboxyvinyltransferase
VHPTSPARAADLLRVEPQKSLRGTLTVPGDKSITHRAFLLGGLARGTTRVVNANPGLDCAASLAAMALLGARVTGGGSLTEIEGVAGETVEPAEVIDCGNSGTTMRLLAGILAAGPGLAILTGDASLRARPMARVIEPLERMGARILARDAGRAPLVVRGASLRGIDYRSPIASAQVKSALLLAGLRAAGRTTVREAIASRDHTERMLRAFGVPIAIERGTNGAASAETATSAETAVSVEGGTRLTATTVEVPGDPSAAAFFVVAALVLPDSEVTIERVAMNPTRRGAIDALIEMGGAIEVRGLTDDGLEPTATIVARSSRLRAIELRGARIPALIDELPILAVAAAFAEGTTTVADAGELRVKESNRIEVLARGLALAGVHIEERADGFLVHGGLRPQGATVDAQGDHRIAMALAILALGAAAPLEIRGAQGIPTSFPGFAEQIGVPRARR